MTFISCFRVHFGNNGQRLWPKIEKIVLNFFNVKVVSSFKFASTYMTIENYDMFLRKFLFFDNEKVARQFWCKYIYFSW